MKNVTITMDEDVARWARQAAAEHEMSLSRFVGEVLRERMRENDAYELAMREFLATRPAAGSAGRPYPTRDEIHERSVVRR